MAGLLHAPEASPAFTYPSVVTVGGLSRSNQLASAPACSARLPNACSIVASPSGRSPLGPRARPRSAETLAGPPDGLPDGRPNAVRDSACLVSTMLGIVPLARNARRIYKPSTAARYGVLTSGAFHAKGASLVRRSLVRPVLLALLLAAASATPVLADVHGVSNAECAAPGAPSGATTPASRAAPGRPDAPIPVSASEGRTQGRGNDADAQGTNC